MNDVIVVGAGIVGATIAEALRKFKNRQVLVIDDGKPLSGTKASGGSIKPSKLTGLSETELNPILDTLLNLFGYQKETFELRPVRKLLKYDIYQLNMVNVFNIEKKLGRVINIGSTNDGKPGVLAIIDGEEMFIPCNLLIIAAGMGCIQILPEIFSKNTLTAKKGVSFRFKGTIKQAFVKTWLPYKQVTVHNFYTKDGWQIWGCDGSALKPENWPTSRTDECLQRISRELNPQHELLAVTPGLRSFHQAKAKPCYFEQVYQNVYVATGAGKFGSISAGWAANRIMEL